MNSISMRVGAIALMALLAASARAEEGWTHTAAIYLVGASIDGTVGLGPVSGDLDIGFDDILDNLDAGFMGAYRGEVGRWAVAADLLYMSLEKKASGLGLTGNETAKLDLDQLMFEVDVNYALTDRLDAVAGLRYWDLESKMERSIPLPPPGTTVAGKVKEDWIDPVVGLRYQQPLGERWTFVGRGDIGGFGVGSDFSWHITAFVGWEMVNNFHWLFGFRYLDIDYEDGSGADRFVFDVAEGGPAIGLTWTF